MPSVLVTGAARGIGRSITTHLADRGWDVVAGVRTQRDADDIVSLNSQRISSVLLDVTDDAQIADLAESLGGLDAVVNNAGIAVGGPMETVSSEEWRKQLEVNVIGQLAVTRAVLPLLRKSRGRIVFISSVNGQLAMPMLGAYCASKFALEAAAHAMRMELRPWRIPVVIVEPAQTDTDMWGTAAHRGPEEAHPDVSADRRGTGEGVRGGRTRPDDAQAPRPLRRGGGAEAAGRSGDESACGDTGSGIAEGFRSALSRRQLKPIQLGNARSCESHRTW
jgi:NAD(P)-dependent dehydrogenase (short-subunit alcohol dehydrogenase family)